MQLHVHVRGIYLCMCMCTCERHAHVCICVHVPVCLCVCVTGVAHAFYDVVRSSYKARVSIPKCTPIRTCTNSIVCAIAVISVESSACEVMYITMRPIKDSPPCWLFVLSCCLLADRCINLYVPLPHSTTTAPPHYTYICYHADVHTHRNRYTHVHSKAKADLYVRACTQIHLFIPPLPLPCTHSPHSHAHIIHVDMNISAYNTRHSAGTCVQTCTACVMHTVHTQ